MRIHLIPKGEPQKEMSLEEVNTLLESGKLDGEEPAWVAGLSDWTILRKIKGVKIPKPPPLKIDLNGKTNAESNVSNSSEVNKTSFTELNIRKNNLENNKQEMTSAKECPNCGLSNPINAIECDCGYNFRTNIQSLNPIKMEKYLKKVKFAGNFSIIYGWLKIILSPIAILFTILIKKEYPGLSEIFKLFNFSDAVLNAFLGFIFLTLGARIKKIYDKNISKYFIILLILSIMWFILTTMAGEKTSGLHLILIYLIIISVGFISFKKLMKYNAFVDSLSQPVYKIKTLGWIIFIFIGIIILIIAVILEHVIEVT